MDIHSIKKTYQNINMERDSLLYKITEGLRDMCYICVKEMKTTVTDEGVLIFFVLVPILYPLLYSWIYIEQVVREVPVAVIDMSRSHASRDFITHYNASPDVKVAYYCNNIKEAQSLMEHQKVKGILYFPTDFQKKIDRGEQTTISVYTDMAIMLNYKAIYQTATNVTSLLNSKIQVAKSNDFTRRENEITTKPLDFDDVPIFNPTGGYADFIIPGVLMLILHQTLLLGIGMSAGTAREQNRYRDLVPVSRHYNGLFRIVLGKSFCYFTIYLLMAAFVTMLYPHLFGFIQLIRFKEWIAIIVPFLLSTIFFGMFVSCTIRYRENVMLLVVFTSVPLLFMSGISWPQSAMPGVWRAIACFFPSTFGIRAFVRANTMGASLSDIAQEYQAMWIQVVVYFFASCTVYRYQIIQARRHALERVSVLKEKAKEATQKIETDTD